MNEKNKNKESSFSQRECLRGIRVKEGEEGIFTALVATTHPDRVGDILSKNAIHQISDFINNTGQVGTDQGSFRSLSLFHDWVHENDPELDEAGFMLPNSRVVELEDGHLGTEVDFRINDYYKGNMTPEEIRFRIDNGAIGGLSIEYNTDDDHSWPIEYEGETYRFIDEFTDFAGAGFARSRMIANPFAVIYKEIEKKVKEAKTMTEKKENKENVETSLKEKELEQKAKDLEAKEKELKEAEAKVEEEKEDVEEKEAKIREEKLRKLTVKEVLGSDEFKELVRDELKIENKSIKTDQEEQRMDGISLSVKEMNKVLASDKVDLLSFKHSVSNYFAENPQIDAQLKTTGIPLKTTLQVKCQGNQMKIVSELKVKEVETKDTLDTTTNPSTYTQSIVEFADVYLPSIIETFNQQTNLFGALGKRDHLEGGNQYGWRITQDQSTGLSVDPDDVTITKTPVTKLKVRTGIKEYRIGVSVADYTLFHSKAAIGDLFMIEVEKRSNDLAKDINGDLFTQQVDTGNQVIGLEAVADSAGNTTIYGLTRTAANRLAPTTAADTYEAIGTVLTEARLRQGVRLVEVEGALRRNLRIIVNPAMRDAIFTLMDGRRRFAEVTPVFGFDPGQGATQAAYDGIPMIVDSDCQTDAVFVVDFESYYIVVSKAPQMIGLAKVSAAEEAYVTTYLATVYEQPRRIHMIDTTS